ncbi:MAG: carboxypeptidase regulatory-like domain-containing protein, partial [bacterium]|nr:carboxypeptidase regulatory-like domain-containing protein [bacterium]
GIVLDPSEAFVPDAEVMLRSNERGRSRTTMTSPAGSFGFHNVAPGKYYVRVNRDGFQPFETSVRAGTRPRKPLRIVLAIAETREEMTVSGQASQVSLEPSENVDVIRLDRKMLDDLPIMDQDVVGAASGFVDSGSVGTGGVTLVVDGMETSKIGVSSSAIQEVRINQNPYSAEFRRPGRGTIEVITKPGSPAYHGAFNFLFRDHRLDARNAFAVRRPPEHRRIFEGHITGPLGKSRKTTFLISGERQEEAFESIVLARPLYGEARENVPNPQRDTELSAKVTRKIGETQTLAIRYEFADESAEGEGVGGFNLPEVAADSTNREHHIYLNHMATITPKLVSQFFLRGGRHDGFDRSRIPGVPRNV